MVEVVVFDTSKYRPTLLDEIRHWADEWLHPAHMPKHSVMARDELGEVLERYTAFPDGAMTGELFRLLMALADDMEECERFPGELPCEREASHSAQLRRLLGCVSGTKSFAEVKS